MRNVMRMTNDILATLTLKSLYRTKAAHWSSLVAAAHGDVRFQPLDGVHYGDAHWRATAAIGLRLAADTSLNPAVVLAFAILHDSQRQHRYHDTDHGRRAATVAQASPALNDLLDKGDMAQVVAACAGHGDGLVADDPALAVCWDADRLAMVQRNKRPHAAYMSTQACRQDFDGAMALARDICAAPPSWASLVAAVVSHRRGAVRPAVGRMKMSQMPGF